MMSLISTNTANTASQILLIDIKLDFVLQHIYMNCVISDKLIYFRYKFYFRKVNLY